MKLKAQDDRASGATSPENQIMPSLAVVSFYLIDFYQFLQTVSVSVSILTLTFISIDRWYAICFPLRYKPQPGRAIFSILIIWSAALLFDLPEFFVLHTQRKALRFDIELFTQCMTTWSVDDEKVYNIVKAIFLYTWASLSPLTVTNSSPAVFRPAGFRSSSWPSPTTKSSASSGDLTQFPGTPTWKFKSKATTEVSTTKSNFALCQASRWTLGLTSSLIFNTKISSAVQIRSTFRATASRIPPRWASSGRDEKLQKCSFVSWLCLPPATFQSTRWTSSATRCISTRAKLFRCFRCSRTGCAMRILLSIPWYTISWAVSGRQKPLRDLEFDAQSADYLLFLLHKWKQESSEENSEMYSNEATVWRLRANGTISGNHSTDQDMQTKTRSSHSSTRPPTWFT